MEIKELQEKVTKRFNQYKQQHNIKETEDLFLLKIQEETGELAKAYLMYTDRARQKEQTKQEIRKVLEEETADLLGCLLVFAEKNKIDLEQAIKNKWLRHLKE